MFVRKLFLRSEWPLFPLPKVLKRAGAANDADSRAHKKFLASSPPSGVHNLLLMNNKDKKTLVKAFLDEAAPHLTSARRAELVELFSAAIDPDTPLPYRLRPAGEDFVTWWAREYGDRGLISKMSYSELERRDPQAARGYLVARDKPDFPKNLVMPIARSGPKRKVPMPSGHSE